MNLIERAVGAVVGSAVGDALGAPFEFGPQGAFSARFPMAEAGEEMRGGGGWDPGEATDDGHDPLRALPEVVALIDTDHRARYATVLDDDWHPDQATEFNGAIWPCLGSAVWALRSTTGFAPAVRAAIDLGGDTDTVAAVTGGLAGAVYGFGSIPARWTEPLHVPVPGCGERVLRLPDLVLLAHRLSGLEA